MCWWTSVSYQPDFSTLNLCRAGFAFLVNYMMVSDKDGWWPETSWAWFVCRCHIVSGMSRWCSILGEWPFPGWLWVNGTNWGTENSSRCLVLKSRSCFLPKSCTRCSGFLSLHLVYDYVAKLAFIQSLVAVIDFIALPFINPTLPALCSLVAFLPGWAILWFTRSPAKLLRSMNFQCNKNLCIRVLCVCSLPYLPVQGLNLISSSCYHPQWVKARLKDNLLECIVVCTPPDCIWVSNERASGVQEQIFN